jgi:hypothetical protein
VRGGSPSHGENRGSSPLGSANDFKYMARQFQNHELTSPILLQSAGGPNRLLRPSTTSLSFDFIRDIVPVVGITREPLVLEVHPSFSARTVPEFIAYAKANPGKINIASPGNGSSGHVAGELFKMMTGTSMVHVPYRGAAPAITDLLGGQVQAYHERKPVGEVVARTAIELHLLAFLSGNDPEAVVFDLVQPRLAGRRLRGGCRKARRDEAPPAGRAKAVA